MTARFYGRRARLVIGDVEVVSEGQNGLRIAFTVQRSTAASANNARVQVYNLKAETRARLDSADLTTPTGQVRRLILEAGYETTLGGIFVGDRAWVSHGKEGTDWLTSIESADGVGVLNLDIGLAFAPNASALDVMRDLLAEAGIQATQLTPGRADPQIEVELAGVVYPKGKTLEGPFIKLATQIARDAGLTFSIQDGEARLSLPRTPETRELGPVLSPGTGLIGSVTRVRDPKKPRAHIVQGTSLLMPTLVPGRRMRLESATETGTFKVTEVTHTGDTHGGSGAWTTRWEAIAV